MELFVGALVVLGFVAIAIRFLPRDRAGGLALPRIVDQSIGMWTLRRMTGRPLGARSWDDDEVDDERLATASAGSAAPSGSAAPVLGLDEPLPGSRPLGPIPVAPVRSVVSSSRPASVVPPAAAVRVVDPPRRERAIRARVIAMLPTATALVGVALVAAVTGGLLAVVLEPRAGRDGAVLGATGRPDPSIPGAALVSGSGSPVGGSAAPEPVASGPAGAGTASPPPIVGPTGTPHRTAAPTVRPAPAKATPRPTARPAPTPTPTPSPTPAPSVEPTPSPSPSAAPSEPPPPSVDPLPPPG